MTNSKTKTNKIKVIRTLLILILVVGSSSEAISQSLVKFGLKAGVNYNNNGDYSGINSSAESAVGFHVGVLGKFGGKVYFRPELVYTNTKSNYGDDAFNMQKIDIPLLGGYKLFGPVSIFAGPSLQYILNSDVEGTTFFNNSKIEAIENDLTVGMQIGFAAKFSKFGADIRYERGISTNAASIINNSTLNKTTLDTRPEQIILSFSYFF